MSKTRTKRVVFSGGTYNIGSNALKRKSRRAHIRLRVQNRSKRA